MYTLPIPTISLNCRVVGLVSTARAFETASFRTPVLLPGSPTITQDGTPPRQVLPVSRQAPEPELPRSLAAAFRSLPTRPCSPRRAAPPSPQLLQEQGARCCGGVWAEGSSWRGVAGGRGRPLHCTPRRGDCIGAHSGCLSCRSGRCGRRHGTAFPPGRDAFEPPSLATFSLRSPTSRAATAAACLTPRSGSSTSGARAPAVSMSSVVC
jgi:hypothetical protein